jgi:hypothetical protein
VTPFFPSYARVRPILLVALSLLAACQPGAEPVDAPTVAEAPPTPPPSGLLSIETTPAAGPGSQPVIDILTEGGEVRDGMLTVDAYEGDRLWLGVLVDTEAGVPLADTEVRFRPQGTAISPPPQLIANVPRTDAEGYLEFQLIVGDAGTYPVTVIAAGVERQFRVNVIPNDFDQWLTDLPAEGLTRWNTLMETRVQLDEAGQLVAAYPAAVRALDGQTVRLAGFMLPLDMQSAQRHFLLAASPPSCFFHVPGGPATVVEVKAEKHPVPGSFEAMVVEGRLKLVGSSDSGVLFQLDNARSIAVAPPRPMPDEPAF